MSDSPPTNRRPARIAELATWTVAWRERWGRRANQLEDEGTEWPTSEIQAFDEVKAAKARGEQPDADLTTTKQQEPANAPTGPAGKLTAGTLNLTRR